MRFAPDPSGLTVVTGENGAGKTSLLEAIGYVALQHSFRRAPREALVQHEKSQAIIRANVVDKEREQLVEIEINPTQRDTYFRNRQRITRAHQLLDIVRVTVFTPDDLVLVKGGPAERRQFLDDVLISAYPKHRLLLQSMDKILRQRNMLLRQANGRPSLEIESTLDVWDAQFVDVGEQLVNARAALLKDLLPRASQAFRALTRSPLTLGLAYQSSYEGKLVEALDRARSDDIRRGISTVGPQRDDVLISADYLDARTRLSQGRQRATTLALRLAAHDVVAGASGMSPVLLLDDVFSELDELTANALFAELPVGQTLLTTAGDIPTLAQAHCTVKIEEGEIL